MLEVRDVGRGNVDDVFSVCSYGRLDEPVQMKGIDLKKKWLLGMMDEYGSCTKVAYLDGTPVGQVLFYPEEAVPYMPYPRDRAVILHCVYNPFPDARRMGVGSALMNELLDECRTSLPCLGSRICSIVVARPFSTGEGFSLGDFYTRFGFLNGIDEMYMEVSGTYEPREPGRYVPLIEDRERAVVLFEPVCEWGYPHAMRVVDAVREIDPDITVDVYNSWDRPEESLKRGNVGVVVNGTPITSYITDTSAFRVEVARALGR
jgi:GNAT superfamily N-acetyltransferase